MESPIHIRRALMCIRRRRRRRGIYPAASAAGGGYTAAAAAGGEYTTAAADGCRYRTVAIYYQEGRSFCFTASIHSDPEWSVILWQDVPCQKYITKRQEFM